MFDRCMYFNLNTLARHVNKIWDEEFKKRGLSPAHAYLLRLVIAEPGVSQSVIAEHLSLTPSTVTRFVDSLSARGLVRRESGEDSRVSQIYPTAAGKSLSSSLEASNTALYKTLRRKLGAKRFDFLVKELREARALISEL